MHLPEHFLLLQFDLRSSACGLCMLWCLLLLRLRLLLLSEHVENHSQSTWQGG